MKCLNIFSPKEESNNAEFIMEEVMGGGVCCILPLKEKVKREKTKGNNSLGI